MDLILEGQATSVQIAGLAVAIKMRGEVKDEVLGFARAMRQKSIHVDHGLSEPVLDTCGTGGDGAGTFNVSTIAAFVIAGAGVKVAKHGGRSASGTFGSADLLEALGVSLQVSPESAAQKLRESGIVFLFAPAFHPAMKHAREARTELKMRTVFNLLGPLTNPARANIQLIGAPSVEAAKLLAEVLRDLEGTTRAFIVHGADGVDEISLTGPTTVYEVADCRITQHIWTPEDFGVPRSVLSKLIPEKSSENIEIAKRVLGGQKGPHTDFVLINAAAGLVAAGRALNLHSGVTIASESIRSGAASAKLTILRDLSASRID